MNEIANIIARLETQKAAIEQALETLRDFETTGSITPAKSTGKAAKKGGMSAEGRRRIALAMKLRWQAKRAGTGEKPATKKRGLTAAGRRKLAEAMKRRWAAKRTAAQAKKKAA